MPSRKPLVRYPSAYRDLFFRVGEQRLVSLTFATDTVAQNVRRDLYNYRLALWEDTPRPPSEHDNLLLNIADKITFKRRDNRLIISIDESPYAEAVAAQLEDLL